jgi:hypothetical protein
MTAWMFASPLLSRPVERMKRGEPIRGVVTL